MSAGTELAVQGPKYSFGEMQVMAKSVAVSRLFSGVENEQVAMTLMLLCDADGLHPINAMRRYHIIKGRPTMRADAMQAEFQRQGGLVRWEESSKSVCRARFVHPTQCPEPGFMIEVSWAECSSAGNVDMYKKFPAPMLRARCVSQGVRAVLPGVVVGIYTPEEVHANLIDVTPIEPTRAQPQLVRPAEPTAVAKPSELPSTRQAVNAEFAPAGTEPSRYPSKETTPLPAQKISAKGLDSRNFTTIVGDETALLNRRVASACEESGIALFEATASHRITNHLVSAVIDVQPDAASWFSEEKNGKSVRFGPGKLLAELHTLYISEWREWLRAALSRYLIEKWQAARERIDNEVHGDGPALDALAEQQSQEPATPPEDESQLAPVPAGELGDDEGWTPGRE